MKKEEILEKYKKEAVDEGNEHINNKSGENGILALCLLAMVLMFYQTDTEQPFGDITALLLIYFSVFCFSRYKVTKEKWTLILAICNGILCLFFLGWYIYQTL